jgi:hypothetical protein
MCASITFLFFIYFTPFLYFLTDFTVHCLDHTKLTTGVATIFQILPASFDFGAAFQVLEKGPGAPEMPLDLFSDDTFSERQAAGQQ